MMLLCDVGNTRVKWALASPRGRFRHCEAVEHRGEGPAAMLERSFGSVPAVDRVVACSVGPAAVNESLEACTRRRWSVAPEWMPSRRQGWGVRCAYAAPETMGADRWAMLVAARRLFPRGACVAGCGTALTVDLLDARGRHLGGVIVPGVALMRRSLTEGTALIAPAAGKVVPLPGHPPGAGAPCREATAAPRASFPDNTPDAVATGTAFAAACTVDRLFALMRRLAGPHTECVLSGGDAEEVRRLMSHEAVVEPCLVLRGLALMAGEEPS